MFTRKVVRRTWVWGGHGMTPGGTGVPDVIATGRQAYVTPALLDTSLHRV